MNLLKNASFVTVYDNSIQAFIPQLWAEESLAILEENMVAAMLVHRDFEPIVANFGDTVNTRRPGQFQAKRKVPADPVTQQDATANNIQVPLNQHIHVSFLIKDGEEAKSFKDLVAEYMAPAMLAQARLLDQIVLGQAAQFLTNAVGGLGQLSATTAKSTILSTRNKMNTNKAYVQGRNLIMSPNSETALLNLDQFIQAYSVGDDGTAIREASLGRRLGFDMYMAQNTSSVTTVNLTTIAPVINHTGGYAKGYAGSILITATGLGKITVGTWLTIAGDYTPYQVTAGTDNGTDQTAVTLNYPLRNAVANSAVLTVNVNGLVNQTVSPTGYAVGWSKYINTDGWTSSNIPQVGQLVSFGATNFNVYTITQVNNTGTNQFDILLDRPLDFAIADEDAVNIGPAGDYNFAFHRNAVALVVRPLPMPRPGTGALSAVVNYNDLSMRATITYQGTSQGHLVTLDMLCGIAILDFNLGAVMLG